MSTIEIPSKSSFKIGEVAELLSLEAYVLRYWETEFDQLKPRKTRTGQRAYARKDIDLLLDIKRLLYDDMYTIAGARKQLELARKKSATPPAAVASTADDDAMLGEVSGLRARTRELEMAMQATMTQMDALKAQHAASMSRSEALQQDLLTHRAALERSTLNEMDLKDLVEQQRAEIASLMRSASETTVETVDAEVVAELETALSAAHETIDTLSLQLSEAEQTVVAAHMERDDAMASASRLSDALATLEAQRNATTAALEAEREAVATLEFELATVRAEAQAATEGVEAMRAHLQMAKATSQGEVEELRAQMASLKAALHDAQTRQAARQQARRQSLTMVRRELEQISRLVAN